MLRSAEAQKEHPYSHIIIGPCTVERALAELNLSVGTTNLIETPDVEGESIGTYCKYLQAALDRNPAHLYSGCVVMTADTDRVGQVSVYKAYNDSSVIQQRYAGIQQNRPALYQAMDIHQSVYGPAFDPWDPDDREDAF